MAKVTEQVEVSKEARVVSKEIAKLVKGILAAKKQGLSAAAVIVVLSTNLQGIVEAVVALSDLPAEEKEDIEAFIAAWELGAKEILGALLAK